MLIRHRKGESLVEVMVSLGILSFILTSAVVLIASTINLNTAARKRTESISLVQQNLNTYMADMSNSTVCSLVSYAPISNVNPAGCNTSLPLTSLGQSCFFVEQTNLSATEQNAALGLNNTNFTKVISRGFWYVRPGTQMSIEVSRIIKR